MGDSEQGRSGTGVSTTEAPALLSRVSCGATLPDPVVALGLLVSNVPVVHRKQGVKR